MCVPRKAELNAMELISAVFFVKLKVYTIYYYSRKKKNIEHHEGCICIYCQNTVLPCTDLSVLLASHCDVKSTDKSLSVSKTTFCINLPFLARANILRAKTISKIKVFRCIRCTYVLTCVLFKIKATVFCIQP